MRRVAFLLAFLLPGLIYAVDSPKVPSEIRVQVGDYVVIKPESAGPTTWYAPNLDWYSPYPPFLVVAPEYRDAFIVQARKPGRFLVQSYRAEESVASLPSITVVIVGDDPGPDPDPDPVPIDDFEKGLFAAWRAETPSPEKVQRIRLLADIYSEAANLAVNNQDLKTVSQLYQTGVLGAVQNTFKPLADPGAEFVSIRKLVGAELNSRLNTKLSDPLDSATRTLCAREFRRVASSLAKLAGVK